jgi:hypothetical protein
MSRWYVKLVILTLAWSSAIFCFIQAIRCQDVLIDYECSTCPGGVVPGTPPQFRNYHQVVGLWFDATILLFCCGMAVAGWWMVQWGRHQLRHRDGQRGFEVIQN